MTSISRLRRFQRLFGLLPLGLIAVYHLWEQSPIRAGRTGVLERLFARFEAFPAWLEGVLLMAPLLVLAGVGGFVQAREPDAETSEGRDRRRNARVAAVISVGFLAWHLTTVWLPARALGEGAIRAMALAEDQLDTLLGASLYVLGWSAFSVMLGYAVVGDAPRAADLGRRALTGLAVGVGFWLWGIDLLAAYVAGASLF